LKVAESNLLDPSKRVDQGHSLLDSLTMIAAFDLIAPADTHIRKLFR